MKKTAKWLLVVTVLSVLSWDITGFAAVYFSDEAAQKHLGTNPPKKATQGIVKRTQNTVIQTAKTTAQTAQNTSKANNKPSAGRASTKANSTAFKSVSGNRQANTATGNGFAQADSTSAAARAERIEKLQQVNQAVEQTVQDREADFPVLQFNNTTYPITSVGKDGYQGYVYHYILGYDVSSPTILIHAHSTLPTQAANRAYLDELIADLQVGVYDEADPYLIRNFISEQDQNYLRILWQATDSDGQEYCEGIVVKKNTRPRVWANVYINSNPVCNPVQEIKKLRPLVIPEQTKFPKRGL